MAHTYSSILLHTVWSTKSRLPLITSDLKHRLYGYIRDIAEDQDVKIIIINGMPDHVHALMNVKPSICISDVMRAIKTSSSKWVRMTFPEKMTFGWQEGYGAFSVGLTTLPSVKTYIQNQEEHHKHKTFEDEFLKFLELHQ